MSEAIFIARGDVLSTAFRKAILKIAACNVLDIKLAYDLQRFLKEVDVTASETHKLWVELVKQYVNVTIDGKFETTESGFFKWKDGVDAKEAEDAIQKFGNYKTPIRRRPLTLEMLRLCELSPADVAALGPVIQDPEIEKQA